VDAALASGVYWIITGRLPVEDLQDNPKKKPAATRKPPQQRQKGK